MATKPTKVHWITINGRAWSFVKNGEGWRALWVPHCDGVAVPTLAEEFLHRARRLVRHVENRPAELAVHLAAAGVCPQCGERNIHTDDGLAPDYVPPGYHADCWEARVAARAATGESNNSPNSP